MVFSGASMARSLRRRIDGVQERHQSTTLRKDLCACAGCPSRGKSRFCNNLRIKTFCASPASSLAQIHRKRTETLPSIWSLAQWLSQRASQRDAWKLEAIGPLTTALGQDRPRGFGGVYAYTPLTHRLALGAPPSRAVANAGPASITQAETHHEARPRPRHINPDARRRHGHDGL